MSFYIPNVSGLLSAIWFFGLSRACLWRDLESLLFSLFMIILVICDILFVAIHYLIA
ncbi:hypothetical protein BDZ91DRAFT_737313 [Kalaharituber pfeilii]|nr:hypothetical protein BDZ91DRAFT_737313 [Kalaharituber pfeilii]